jgi:2-polyprenyl-3-methyl-5-hydroxy-6-metoxy-1,4-benzoquinol methylase
MAMISFLSGQECQTLRYKMNKKSERSQRPRTSGRRRAMSRIGWDKIYRTRRLDAVPWHSGQPDGRLIQLINQKRIPKGRVLDMCSGDGTNSIYLASKGFDVFGVDISSTAVRIARRRCEKRNVSCAYEVGDVLSIAPRKKFDLVFDRGCFHHMSEEDKPRYINTVKRLLRPGGKFFLLCFSDKNPPYKKNLSKEDIKGHFGHDFRIHFIKDSVHREPPRGTKRYLYASFMELVRK